jgi:hypothetical protein
LDLGIEGSNDLHPIWWMLNQLLVYAWYKVANQKFYGQKGIVMYWEFVFIGAVLASLFLPVIPIPAI